MPEKKSMIIYTDTIEQWQMLSDQQAGALIKALLHYGMTGERIETDDGMLQMAFSFIAAQIDRDGEKWDDARKKRVEAAQKRWEKKQTDAMQCNAMHCMQVDANDANASFALQNMQKDANDAVTVTVTDTVTGTVINNNKEDKPPKKQQAAFHPPSLDEVKAYCEERQNGIDPERFVDYYTSNGWIVGKTKMKDWKAAVRQWERNEKGRPQKAAPSVKAKENFQNDSFDSSDIDALFAKNLFK